MKNIILGLITGVVIMLNWGCQPTMTPEDTEGEAINGQVPVKEDGNKTTSFLRVNSPNLPMVVGDDTIWTEQHQSKDGSRLTFVYEVPYTREQYTSTGLRMIDVSMNARGLVAGELANLIEQFDPGNLDQTVPALKSGVTFNYVYRSSVTGGTLYEFDLHKRDLM